MVKLTNKEVLKMTLNQIEEIKSKIEKNIGEKIIIVAKQGKRRIVTQKGIIMNAYPGVFVVKITDSNNNRIVSYSYSDILTKTVKLSVAN